jgi:hypothetical protein
VLRVLLTNEAGAGRGHALALRFVAESLGQAFDFEAALYRPDTHHLLAPVCGEVFAAAGLTYDRGSRAHAGSAVTATWGEFLGDLGFRDAAFLRRQIGWWMEFIHARRPDIVICDEAPCALLAAKAANVPAALIGVGYSLPADGLAEFPVLLPEHSVRIHDERRMADAVNEAAAPLGLRPIARLPEIYEGAIKLQRCLPGFDPYERQRPAPPIPPVRPAGAAGEDGDEMFIYLSEPNADPPAVLDAICALPQGIKRRAFVPGMDDSVFRRLTAAGIEASAHPFDLGAILPRTRMMLHYGQLPTAAMAMAAGLPQAALPQHLEHLYHARRAESLGVMRIISPSGRSSDAIRDAILDVYHDDAMAEAARRHAPATLSFLSQDAGLMIRERLRPALVDIIRRNGLA